MYYVAIQYQYKAHRLKIFYKNVLHQIYDFYLLLIQLLHILYFYPKTGTTKTMQPFLPLGKPQECDLASELNFANDYFL